MNYSGLIMERLPGKKFMLLSGIIIIISLQFNIRTGVTAKEVGKYYTAQLNNFEKRINSFRKSVMLHSSKKVLQEQFYLSRLSYKKVAVLSEYFNGYTTRLLNSPALDWVRDDEPQNIIPPKGLQAIELLLFSDWKESSYPRLVKLLNDMLKTISLLKKGPDLTLQFKNEFVWDALRSATIRLISLGITGYDSPIAQYSFAEARASLESIKDVLIIFRNEYAGKNTDSFKTLLTLFNNANAYLSSHNNFNGFDRFTFINRYINPFYAQLVKTRKSLGISVPQGSNPVNFDAESIFDENAMNINFYAPGSDYSVTKERVLLGKKLFSDPILSGTNTRSCASCHKPEKAFTDGLKVPEALDARTILIRNTPTLWNSALQTRQFMDSRADILENQLDEVVHNANEMKGSLKKSIEDLKKDMLYKNDFKKAYPNQPESINAFNIANAISSYVRSLVGFNSRFDQAIRSDENILTPEEKNGFNLFTGKGKCATCHFIPVFNGLVPPFFTETESEVLGVPKTKNKNPAELDTDLGKFLFTTATLHKYSFKTPTLRNIELTAPYMHNGVYNTLEEVIEFYNNGGGKGLKIAPPYQSLPFDKLNLSKKEISDIISFMKTLTDTTYQQYK